MQPSGIGGQAVIEGIMMRNQDKYSIAVRKPDHEIEITVRDCNKLKEKYKWLNYPIIRGIYSFIDSLVTGISTINYSAAFYDDPAEQKSTKLDEIGKSMFKDKVEAVFMAFTVLLSIAFAIGLFMLVPYFVSRLLSSFIASSFLLNFVEGVLRVGLFLLYIMAISHMKDIRRTFMYHGAEHKCINCIENGLRLTVDNVRLSSRFHKRCGTSFLFLVMFISIVFFIFIRVDNTILQLIVRILLMPVIAGVSYEVIRLAGKSENKVIHAISLPGLWMQKFTTKEPEDDMIEVAIKAVEEVFDWRVFLNEFYKESDNPEADLKANEAEVALAASVSTGADKQTRTVNLKEVQDKQERTSSDTQEQVQFEADNDMLQAMETNTESEDTIHDKVYEELVANSENDELPEGFEIIEDDETYEHGEYTEAVADVLQDTESATETVHSVADTPALEQLPEDDGDVEDGFEFMEADYAPEDYETGDDLPIFRQRADKKHKRK